MKKRNGNLPSAYQTITQFCEETSFHCQDNSNPVGVASQQHIGSAVLKLLTTNPLRRKRATLPGQI